MQEITTKDQFKKMLKYSRQYNKLVVIDFFADWCGPCKMLAPEIELLAQKYTNAVFYKINISGTELKPLCDIYGITKIPVIYYFKNGKNISNIVGTDINKIESEIKNQLYSDMKDD